MRPRRAIFGFLKPCALGLLLGGLAPARLSASDPAVPTNGPAVAPMGGATQAATNSPWQNIQDIRRLTPAQAARHQPVRVRGVITYADPGWQHYFVQDATGGIYVRAWQEGLRAGRAIELEGTTDPGGVARMLINAVASVVGPTNFPAPQREGLTRLTSEALDSTWVEVEGVVRSLRADPARLTLKLVNREGEFLAVVPGHSNATALKWAINTRLRLQGVCKVLVTAPSPVRSFELRVPQLNCITVLEKAPTNAFAIPAVSVRRAVTTSAVDLGLRRIRVQGVITLVKPHQEFFLQGSSIALRVLSDQTNLLQLGRGLEVVGFPVTEGAVTHLEEAIFRYEPPGAPPYPRFVHVPDLLATDQYRNELVTLEGYLLHDADASTLPALLLQSGRVVFQAKFEPEIPRGDLPIWQAGSRLRLTGVGEITGATNQTRVFVLSLRRPEDVEVLGTAPWLNTRRLLIGAAGLLTLTGAVLGWVGLLQRQVRKQTAQIRRRLEAEAILEKRLSLVWETSADGMRMTDANGENVRVNEAYCRLVDKPRAELEGQLLTVVYDPGQRAHILESYRRRFRDRAIPPAQETDLVLWNGRKVWLDVSNSFFEQAGQAPLVLSQFRDVTERKRAEGALRASLLEKEVLLKEVHHRVKNNLQVVSSLLSLRAGQTQSPEAQLALQDTEERIRSIALLHETLYRTGNLAQVDFPEYVESLCTHLCGTFGEVTARVKLERAVEPVALELDAAITCGLIINELVSNAFKYAFPNGRTGLITVALRYETPARIGLTVRDNGAGLPTGLDVTRTESLGLQLVQRLARKLGGTVTVQAAQGTIFHIGFELQPKGTEGNA